jgi:hypothetical protein
MSGLAPLAAEGRTSEVGRFGPTAVVALVHNSETSSLTLSLSCAQSESGNGGLVFGGAPLLGVTTVPEAAVIHQLSSPLGQR